MLVHIKQNNRRPVERVLSEFELRRRQWPRGEFQSDGIAVRPGHHQLLYVFIIYYYNIIYRNITISLFLFTMIASGNAEIEHARLSYEPLS